MPPVPMISAARQLRPHRVIVWAVSAVWGMWRLWGMRVGVFLHNDARIKQQTHT